MEKLIPVIMDKYPFWSLVLCPIILLLRHRHWIETEKRWVDSIGDKMPNQNYGLFLKWLCIIYGHFVRVIWGLLSTLDVNANSGCVGMRHTTQKLILFSGLFLKWITSFRWGQDNAWDTCDGEGTCMKICPEKEGGEEAWRRRKVGELLPPQKCTILTNTWASDNPVANDGCRTMPTGPLHFECRRAP